MRAERRRTKKLIVAFHFNRGEQAGWKCDSCRKAGLEASRRCGWLGFEAGKAPVWARGGIATFRCPKSVITAESQGWLEAHTVLSRFGPASPLELRAKDVEAFFVIENELNKERSDG